MKVDSLIKSFCFMLPLMSWSAQYVCAEDWPQFRHDANRSAATSEQLSETLHLQWVHEFPTPRPAFPTEVRLRFDAGYEPVVMGDLMYVPSMVTDTVTALDTKTGEQRWQFFAEGPVRFAPLAWEDKVYVISDDGYLYCLSGADGKLIWKFRGAPRDRRDRRLLGNKRLISVWPARGGPVLADGVVYFAAGIWPDDGVFVHAVNAISGAAVWSNTNSHQIPRANMDHGIAQYAGLAPQGYLAIINQKLVLPCGAQLAAFLDLKTGALGDYTMGWGGRVGLPKGSWFVAGAGKYLSHSGDLYDTTRPNDEKFDDSTRKEFKNMLYPGGLTRLQIDPSNQRPLGAFRQPVMTPDGIYYNDHETGIVGYDLAGITVDERSSSPPQPHRSNDKFPDKWRGRLSLLWTLPSTLDVHIRAGKRLYAGGPDEVEAIDLPIEGGRPKISWRAKVEGTPHRMLAANGRLFVLTLEGRIYAFGADVHNISPIHQQAKLVATKRDAWTERTTKILNETNAREGYAVVLGLNDGRLVEELLHQSKLSVIAVDQDESKVAALRRKLHDAGLYGVRAAVCVGDPLDYPLPPYLANLVVSEDMSALRDTRDGQFAEAIYHSLRPYGGTACLELTSEQQGDLLGKSVIAKLPRSAVQRTNEFVLLSRQGPLPDAADWSHEGGNAANAGASQDRFLKAPLSLLWFDGSIRWNRKPGSAFVRVAGGRIIVKADRLLAVDVYTGRVLWERPLPAGDRNKVQLVAVDDGIYVSAGDSCLVIDPATGEQSGAIQAPANGDWANVRVWDNYFVASVGNKVVCVHRDSGKTAWTYECGRNTLSLAVGNGRVFCTELINERRGETVESANLKTRSLDIRNGEVNWEIANGSPIRYGESHDLLVTSSGTFRGADGRRLRGGIASAQIVGQHVVSGTGSSFNVFDLQTGDKQGDELNWVRRGCTDLRSSCYLVTTRFKGNAAYVDLESRDITSLWNIRSACNNNLFPANGILNVPNLSGGCECNYTPTSKAFAPLAVIERNQEAVRSPEPVIRKARTAGEKLPTTGG
ncbi:MAG: PQQ-binding-like beta-propeller repeat protein [Fuerstiella sp.]|nr:PQQ-binding-like beta-propeller repeat protein [Fuerstiella sp.]MCP4858189.1 PQQ-binding-like beta-propeller repeat protein [Fuerstiella sp.]